MSPLLLLALALHGPETDHPLALDRTGIEWTVPFDAARERGEQTRRLLLVKPVAFGTTPDGCW